METRCEKCNRVLVDQESILQGMGPCCRAGEPYRCPYEIIVDTREQLPFLFDGIERRASQGSQPVEASIVIRTLPVGDYSLDGFEGEVAIERKSKSDLYGTLGRGRERFTRELEILDGFAFAAVVVECDWFDILNLPPAQTQVPPQAIEGSILGLQQDFPGVHWILCQHRRHAEFVTWWLLDRYWRKHGLKPTKVDGSNSQDSASSRPASGLF